METASGGALIYWTQTGQGAPVVLLHGNGECGEIFHNQVDALSTGYSVITIDSRGHGRSTWGVEKLSLYNMADDVIAVLDDIGLEKANIIGFSDGGNIGLILAVKYPRRVISLAISGANADPSGVKLRHSLPMWLKQIWLRLCGLFSGKAALKRELLELMINEPKLQKWNLEAISCPTLITVGKNDMITQTHTQFIHNNIKESQLYEFPGGHFTPTDLPGEYNEVILKFLRRHN